MPDEISVRQWQKQFRAGAFDGKDIDTQRKAGWWDWHCRYDALAERLKRIAPVVMGIREPAVLDNYYLWFINNRSRRKLVYDSVRFEPLSGVRSGKFFMVDLNNPDEPDRWALFTERFSLSVSEYGCTHVRDMVKYISGMACELEQGIRPLFLEEKAAAVEYILGRDVLYPSRAMRREDEHSYSFLDRDDGRRKTVYIVRNPKDAPPDLQTREINGLYVYCPEDAEPSLPSQRQAMSSVRKRRTPER